MIPISALLSSAEKGSKNAPLSLDDMDDDDSSGALSVKRGGLWMGVALSGILSAFIMI